MKGSHEMVRTESMITSIYVYTQVCRHRNLWKDAKEISNTSCLHGERDCISIGYIFVLLEMFYIICYRLKNKTQKSKQPNLETSKY